MPHWIILLVFQVPVSCWVYSTLQQWWSGWSTYVKLKRSSPCSWPLCDAMFSRLFLWSSKSSVWHWRAYLLQCLLQKLCKHPGKFWAHSMWVTYLGAVEHHIAQISWSQCWLMNIISMKFWVYNTHQYIYTIGSIPWKLSSRNLHFLWIHKL